MDFFEIHCCLFYSNDRNLYSQVELDVFKWYKKKILTVKIIPIPLTISGIQNRPLASRNFLKQPVMRDLDFIDNNNYTAADDIHDNGFFVGNGSKVINEPIDKLYEVISSFVE